MREKRRGERKIAPPLLTYQAEEILVAKNRNFSPLVLSFIYEPENIALRDLGTLFGTFIVTDHHEDSSYIVNCLAAAAKKEYFINSRRSVEESFESTLHKINLTLGKLVRDGHINWMGKLHGSIIAIRNRHAYFSVTGEATILLLRKNILSAISEGLSDPEAALHPLKTFTDISEGTLLTEDKIILSTPELLELLPHTLLEREASKLSLDRFAQLLRTALVNERSAAATILIDFSETSPENEKNALRMAEKVPSPEESMSHPTLVENAWSSQTFRKNPIPATSQAKQSTKKDSPSPSPHHEETEHIDNRTGHIYIQADSGTPPAETETALDRILAIIGEQLSIFALKIRKQGNTYSILFWRWISGSFSSGTRASARWIRSMASFLAKSGLYLIQKSFFLLRNAFSRGADIRNISFPKKIRSENAFDPSLRTEKSSVSILSRLRWPHFSVSLRRISFQENIHAFFSRSFSLGRKLLSGGMTLWRNSSRNGKRFLVSMAAIIVMIGIGTSFSPWNSAPAPVENISAPLPLPEEPTFPPKDEPLGKEISGQELLSLNQNEQPATLVILRDKLFVIGRHSVINMESKVATTIPDGASPILHASAMDDLNAIFLYGQDKKIYTYYPNIKSLVENIFPIPTDFTISDMGTYLTYLYAFDAKQGRILRFPRAEGGFGAPTEWLKEKLTFDENAKMSIGENILIGSKNTVFSFTKGKGGMIKLGETKTPILIQDISVSEDGSLTILDTTEKRIVHFGNDGQLMGQYFDTQLGDANSLATSTNGSIVFITTKEKILSFELQ